MAELLIGYDIEGSRFEDIMPGITSKFLNMVHKIHIELDAPCTLFIMGKTLESHIDAFNKFCNNSIFDIQQHTYSHISLKNLVENGRNGRCLKGVSLEEIQDEVKKTNELLKKHLGVRCIGLTSPNGYYQGLKDRPDILGVLHRLGIRFTRTYGRNDNGYQPVPFEIQPFWYEEQGFPDMLEIPMQGWQDWLWREEYGWERTTEYLEHLKSEIDIVKAKNFTWSWVGHDVTCLRSDPEMKIVKGLIEYALSQNVDIMSCREFYEKEWRKRQRSPLPDASGGSGVIMSGKPDIKS